MKPILLLPFFILLLFSSALKAQNNFHIAPQLGLSLLEAKLSQTKNYTLDGFDVRPSRSLSLGPIVGILGEIETKGRLTYGLGLQYQRVQSQSSNRLQMNSVHYNYEDQFILHKLCLPVQIAYTFQLRKSKGAFLAGIRPNLILSSQFKDSYAYYTSQYPDEDDLHFFSRNEFVFNNLYNQWLLGIAITMHEKWTMTLNYLKGSTLYQSVHPLKDVRNSELSLLLAYKFSLKTKSI